MNFRKYRPQPRLLTVVSIVILVLLGGVSYSMTRFSANAVQQKTANEFSWATGKSSESLQHSMNHFATVLYMGRSYVLNSPYVTQTTWSGFFRNQDIFGQFPGMNSVNYIQLVPDSQKEAFVAEKRKLPEFGASYKITPEGTRDVYGLGIYTLSKNNVPLSGFDVYSTLDRRLTYQTALGTGQPTVSAQTQLNTDRRGIFLVLPVTLAGDRSSFVNVVLYTDDFFNNAIPREDLDKMAIRITDITEENKQQILYATKNWEGSQQNLTKKDKINFGGRVWSVEYRAQQSYIQQIGYKYFPYLVFVAGTMLAAILILILYIIFRTVPKDKPNSKLKG